MSISYKDIRNDRQWKASTGLSQAKFEILVKLFGQTYEDLFGESLDERRDNSTSESTFKTYADLLFFGLYSIKSGLTYDLLGLSFDLSGANAYKNQAICLRVLQATLAQGDYLPQRVYNTVEEFKAHWKEEAEILIDATEQRLQRPGNEQDQRSDYSGKKKGIR